MTAVAISGKAVTLPILKIVQSGKIDGTVLGEGMVTKQGVFELVEIGGVTLHGPEEIGLSFKWRRIGD